MLGPTWAPGKGLRSLQECPLRLEHRLSYGHISSLAPFRFGTRVNVRLPSGRRHLKYIAPHIHTDQKQRHAVA